MNYVYVLKSEKDDNLYIGSTDDLRRRYHEHNKGRVKSTKDRIPLVMLFYEAYQSKTIAQKREKYLKSSDGHKDIYKRLK